MKTDDQQKEEILARTDMIELCDALGLAPKGKVARCPAHDDQGRPNLAIYPRNVHCFACGFNADAFALVMKVKATDFRGAFDFLAGRLGLLRADDRANGARGLGYGKGRKTGDPYPKPAQLPATPSPTLSAGDHGDPAGEVLPDLPVELWRDFDDIASAIAYLDDDQVAGFRSLFHVAVFSTASRISRKSCLLNGTTSRTPAFGDFTAPWITCGRLKAAPSHVQKALNPV